MFQSQQAAEFGRFCHVVWFQSQGYKTGVVSTRQELWNIPLQLRKAVEARHVSAVSLHGGKRGHCVYGKSEAWIALETPMMLKMPVLQDIYQGQLIKECGTSPTERSMLQSTNLKEVGVLKSTLTSDMTCRIWSFPRLQFQRCRPLI